MRKLAILLLFGIVLLSLFVRLKSVDDPHLLEFDTVYIFRTGEEIVKKGFFEPADPSRYFPNIWDSREFASVSPYTIAGLCWTNPACDTKFAGKWYGPFFAVLSIIVMAYLGYRANREFFFSAIFLALAPGFLFRSVAGFSDKDTAAIFFYTLSIYFIYRMFQERDLKLILFQAVFAGIALGIGGLTMGLWILFLYPIAIFCFIQIAKGRIDERLLGFVLLSLISIVIQTFNPRGEGILSDLHVLLVVLAALATFVIYLWNRFNPLKQKDYKLRVGTAVGVSAAIGLVLMFLIGFNPISFLTAFSVQIVNPIRGSVHAESVGEQQPSYWVWPWDPGFTQGSSYWNQMEWFFFVAPLIFLIVLYSDNREKLKGALFFTAILTIALASGILTSIVGDFLDDVILLVGYFLILVRYAEKEEDILTACFFGFNIFSASKAVRLFFTLMPAMALASSRVFSFAMERTSKDKLLNILAILLFVGLAFQSFRSINQQSTYIHTSVNDGWYEDFKWIDQNTGKGSPEISWWDYGYWIQYFSKRPSVADGANTGPGASMDQFLGLFFTERNETKAAEWLNTLHLPIVELKFIDNGKETGVFNNDVFASEYFERFRKSEILLSATCLSNQTLRSCTTYKLTPPLGKPVLTITYRGFTTTIEDGKVTAENEQYAMKPFLKQTGNEITFGYEPFDNKLPIPKFVTLDSTMVGKIYWASRIGGRPMQYSLFQYVEERDTPQGRARLYSGGGIILAAINSNGTTIPLIVSQNQGQAIIDKIVTPDGVFDVQVNATKTPGAVLFSGNIAIYIPPGFEDDVFTNLFLLNAGPSKRFETVFDNGFAKTFSTI